MWDAIFFDFDGVILDSTDVKTQAYGEMYRPYGNIIESRVREYHLAHTGASRFAKLKYWHEEYLGIKVDSKKLLELCDKFSNLVLKKVIESPFVEGAENTVRNLRNINMETYVVTGTPDDEIKLILNRRGLSNCFKEAHGSPRSKEQILDEILNKTKYNVSRCLFIGDGLVDYEAAKHVGMEFLGIVKTEEVSPFPDGTVISNRLYVPELHDFIQRKCNEM